MNHHQPLYPRRITIVFLVAVFLLSGALFSALQAGAVFPDPDSFYHIKTAQLIARQGVMESFPWLTQTGLTSYYTDQHFLYHVILAPFVGLVEPIFGAQMATVLLNALLVTVFAGLLLRLRVRSWYVFVAILLVTNPFLFRVNLVKAPGLSILFLLVGLWLLFSRRVWPLVALSFFYVWTYGGFVLLGFFTAVYVLASAVYAWHRERSLSKIFHHILPWRRGFAGIRRERLLTMFLAVAGGTVAGVLVNPYFPKNLFFYWQQLVQIGIVNFQKVVNVGGEWHPYGFVELLANTVFVSIAVVLAVIFFCVYRRRQSAESWTMLLLTLFFFLITLKSRRYVELYVPFATLFAAVSLRDSLLHVSFRNLWRSFLVYFRHHRLITIIVVVYFCAATLTVVIRDQRQLVRDFRNGFTPAYLEGASAWLRENTAAGSIIVHSDWDEFPILFYHNDHNRYIVGLDPTFMYVYDRALYQRWADLTSGRRSDDATQIITQDLHSSTVLVTKDHQAFDATMRQQEAFRVAYEDDEAKVYVLKASGGVESSGQPSVD